MKTVLNRLCICICCLAFAGIALTGCESSPTASNDAVAPGALAAVCTECGQIKGSENCCDPNAQMCAGCDLHAGSPGCCKIEKGSSEAVNLCTACGHFAGSDMCCADGAETCEGCGLHAGSPGCCKIE